MRHASMAQKNQNITLTNHISMENKGLHHGYGV